MGRRSAAARRWCSPTTTRATGCAAPSRRERRSRLTRHEATPSGPGFARVVLHPGDAAARHEAGRARVQGDGARALRAGRARPSAPSPRSARCSRWRRASPAAFEWRRRGPLYRALLEASPGPALRRDRGRRPADCSKRRCVRWTRLARQRYGGERLALGGGVFMNVKANMLIADESWVGDLFVFPSCGDESNAVGAAYLGYLDLCARRSRASRRRSLRPGVPRTGRARFGDRGRDQRARPRRAATR